MINYTTMIEVETGRFTVGVFQDMAWAQKGVDALKRAGLPAESLTIIAKESDDMRSFIERALGGARRSSRTGGYRPGSGPRPDVKGAPGTGERSAQAWLGGHDAAGRFSAHDSRIFDTLTSRGGVLVSIHSEPRAADALAVLHSYGGGNAAIGAWTGRV